MKSAEIVPISAITYDPSLQMRASTDEATVENYAELLRESDHWPFASPVTLFDIGGTLVLADGWHRVEAAKRANLKCVSAHVRTGSFAEAFRFSLSANGDHGLGRSIADKRKAVESALANADYYDLSNRELAKTCAVSESFVRKVHRERHARFEHLKSEMDRCLSVTMDATLNLGEMAWSTGAFDECRNMFLRGDGFGAGKNSSQQWELILETANPELAETEREVAKEKLRQIYIEMLVSSIV